jgi:hypothetical protein
VSSSIAPNRPKAATVCRNDRKYYSLERAREVLGYDPQDNSAHFDGEERVVDEN